MSKITKITLSKPIGKGEGKTKEINLREPKAGELRGIAMIGVYQMDVETFDVLLPRITTPQITKQDITDMSMLDIGKLMGGVLNFLPDQS